MNIKFNKKGEKMFNKFFKFLKGYVIIELTGSDAERFINICIRRGIDVSDIKCVGDGAFILCIPKKDFKALRSIAQKTKTKVHIKERHGAFYFKRLYGKRYAFMGGALFLILFFAITSQFIWVVKIEGVYESSKEQIIQILEDNGIKAGALKRRIPPISDIKSQLINRTDTISWAWVYIEGACARVEVYERRLKPQSVDRSQPCDIVAASDGFIKRIDIKKGERKVENETAVSAGDVLISGKVAVFKEGYEEKYMQVHAEGLVEAFTYHQKEKEQKLYHESRIKTGREKTYYSAEIFGKLYNLFFKENPKYESYDIKQKRHELILPYFGYSGLCINEKRYCEVEVYKEPITEAAAAVIARNELEEQIAKELFKNARLQDKTLEWERINNDTIKVKLKMTFLEDIGTETTINEE